MISMSSLERINREEIYKGRVITLHRDTLRLSEGTKLVREVVEHPGAVVVLALDGDDLLFVRQHRYAAGEELLEFVAGGLEPGEDPAEAADRELQEEAGFKAGRLTKLGEFFSAPGFCSEKLHLFLAEDLIPSKLPGDEDEEIELVRMTKAEALRLAREGAIRDAKTLAGLLLWAVHR
jgi:ADP-ribose pyrophosphatase